MGKVYFENKITLDERGLMDGDTKSPIASQNRLIREIESDQNLPLKVPSKLTNPDRLIVDARNNLAHDNRLYSSDRGLISTQKRLIDIRIAPGNVRRALRFMDTFIKLIRARGHQIEVSYGATHAIVSDIEINICLQEKLRFEETINEYNWKTRHYFPSGILTFRAWVHFLFHQKVWTDGKKPIENKLSRILAGLEFMAKKEINEQLERKKRRKEQEEKDRIEREIRERKEQELKDFKNLLNQANRWCRTKMLREYIQAVENNSTLNGKLSEELKNWLSWAKQKANWYDPLVEENDALLTNVDRNFQI